MKDKGEYFAERLRESMAGVGTRDSDLIRIVVTRCEVKIFILVF